MLRTISASESTALASPTAKGLMRCAPPRINAANTITIVADAALMVRPLAARPWVTAASFSLLACHGSWMRLVKKAS